MFSAIGEAFLSFYTARSRRRAAKDAEENLKAAERVEHERHLKEYQRIYGGPSG